MTIDEFIEHNILTDIWSVERKDDKDKVHEYVCFRYVGNYGERICVLCVDDYGKTYGSLTGKDVKERFDSNTLTLIYSKYKIKKLLEDLQIRYPSTLPSL